MHLSRNRGRRSALQPIQSQRYSLGHTLGFGIPAAFFFPLFVMCCLTGWRGKKMHRQWVMLVENDDDRGRDG